MHYLKIQKDNGKYIDKNGVRYDVLRGTFIYQPHKAVNEGCQVFDSLEDALEAYGLEEYKDSEEE